MPKTKRRQQVEHVVMIPVDWLEERSGIVGGIKYFLFRKVPGETNWFHTLGSATLTAFIVQLVTGVILAMYYKPDPEGAYASIERITNDLTLGWLVRGMHRWGASVFIILLFLHMGRVFLFGAYKYPRELNWLIGVFILLLAMLEGFTGYLLPWDQTAYWATVVGININANAPIAGPFIADFLRSGTEIGVDTLARFYSLHMLVIPGALIGVDHAAPVPRRPPRRDRAAVVGQGRRLRADRERRAARHAPGSSSRGRAATGTTAGDRERVS